MALVELRFSERNRERILTRNKFVTTRRTAHGVPGDHFVLDGRRFEFRLVSQMRLGHVAEFYYPLEGCASPQEFLEEWVRNYDLVRPPNLFDLVFLHEFSEVVTPPPPG